MISKYKRTLLWTSMILLLLIWMTPVLTMLITSFSTRWAFPDLVPRTLDTSAWRYVLVENMDTYKSLRTTMLIAFLTIIINLIVGIPAADALGRYKFKGKALADLLVSLPIVLPPIAIILGLHRTFLRLNLTESLIGVVLANVIPTLPYMIRAISVGFENLGFNWDEQAMMLGANRFQRLWYVTFPALLPSLIAGSSLCILISASQYVTVLLIGGGLIKTVPVIMFPFLSGGNQSIGSAYGFLFSAMALFLLVSMDLVLNRLYGNRKSNDSKTTRR